MNFKLLNVKYYFLELLIILEKIRFNSSASCQRFIAFSFKNGSILTLILNQCLVSLASLLLIPIL